ncbi:MAG TPA: ABC transporter permease [Terriglobales bacterium]|nr:ABC transporter permease [Terriglobales bacterium]
MKAGGQRRSMFLRMLLRAWLVQPGRMALAFLAVVIAASIVSTSFNLYLGSQTNLLSEFRNYGANVIVTGRDGGQLPVAALDRMQPLLPPGSLAVEFSYAVARTHRGQAVVVAGVDFDKVRQLNSWWSVNHWPRADLPGASLLGSRLAPMLSPKGESFELSFDHRSIQLAGGSVLRTGGDEDQRVYLPMQEFIGRTGVRTSVIEIAVNGSPEEITATLRELSAALPEADVRPIQQMVDAEARVLDKTHGLVAACSTLIIITTVLCMLSTLTSWVLDRRKDFAVMKALGASDRLVNLFFAAQAGIMGVLGGCTGFLIGVGLAQWIARVNFHAGIATRPAVFPAIVLGSIALALAATVVPLSLLHRVEPAAMLRGE